MPGADEAFSRVKTDTRLKDQARLRFGERGRCVVGIVGRQTDALKKAVAFIHSPLSLAFHGGIAIRANHSVEVAGA